MCGLSKKHQWKRETWWWDDKVEEAVKKKRECFKRHIALAKARQRREAEDAKVAYNEAKRLAKHVVWQAKSVAEREIFSNIAPNNTGIFKFAKQMDKTNQDVVGEKCVRNDADELSLSDEEKMKAWVEHYARLLNVEWIFYVFVLSCVCYVLCASVYMCFVVTCWERADLLALVCGVFCEFVTFPLESWVRCGT